jgi:integrase
MKLLNITDMAPELAHPGFWDQKKLIFLKSILFYCPKQVIQKIDLSRIKSHIVKSVSAMFFDESSGIKYSFTKKEQKECNDVIEMLQNHGWICTFFQLKNKTTRPSVIPSSTKELRLLNQINLFRDEFWGGQTDFHSNVKTMLVIEMLSGSGVIHPSLLGCEIDTELLSSLKGSITLPVANGSSCKVRIPLSARATLLLEWIKINPEVLSKKIHLETHDIKVLPALLYLSGLEAVIYTQLQKSQLPVAPPEPNSDGEAVFRYTRVCFETINTNVAVPKLIHRERRKRSLTENSESGDLVLDQNESASNSSSQPSLSLTELQYQLDSVEDNIPWVQECLISIGKVRFHLKSLLTNSKGIYQNGVINDSQVRAIIDNTVEETLERAKKRALLKASIDKHEIDKCIAILRQSHTCLELACSRIHYHLCQQKNSLDTCLKEISSVFEHGLLLYPVADLRAWDEEDLELLVSDFILEREGQELAENTKFNYLKNFIRVIRFARREQSLFSNLEFPEIDLENGLVLTSRNHVLGPSEFDYLKPNKIELNRLIIERDPTLILAFYGGMRSGEIARLSLKDIVSNDDELIIYIRKGKTPSAKRSIPLHLLAPPKAVKVVKDYYEARLINYRAHHKKLERKKQPYDDRSEVQFLSTDGRCEVSTAAKVIEKSLSNLKEQIGNGADLHLLRHSFASMMFLRWYCCKYPDFVKELVDKKHWCFSKKGLENLRIFFGEKPNEPIPDSNITAAIHLIKLMGHRDTNTFFQVYVHSYDAVLEHALNRIHNKTDSIDLPGKLITELIPNFKSRASQVKLKSRTTKFLVSL